jgi:hypothetical protein
MIILVIICKKKTFVNRIIGLFFFRSNMNFNNDEVSSQQEKQFVE